VLFEDEDGNIHISHASFVDFPTDDNRAPQRIYVDPEHRHLELAHICDLETSYCMNVEAVDLRDRMKLHVSADLHYSYVH
jgi:hypothetical protein